MKEILLLIGGLYNLAFAVFHILFWKIFRWKKSLRRLLPMDRAIMQVLNIRLIYIFFAFAFISFFYPADLISTQLGNVIIFIILFFWLMRAIEQVLFFSLKRKISIIFFFVFLIGCIIYLIPLII